MDLWFKTPVRVVFCYMHFHQKLLLWLVFAAFCRPMYGTTLILIANRSGVVLAADSKSHFETNRLAQIVQAKVFRIGSRLVVGFAGPMGVVDDEGRTLVDLSGTIPDTVRDLSWNNIEKDTQHLKEIIREELGKMERILLTGLSSEDAPVPTLFVLFAGYAREGRFLRAIRFTGTYTKVVGGHTIKFDNGAIGREGSADSAKASVLFATRDPDIQAEVMRFLRGEDVPPKEYSALNAFRDAHLQGQSGELPMEFLKSVASEIVKYTIARDSRIGGSVQVEVVEGSP